jgi:hypothetical protein
MGEESFRHVQLTSHRLYNASDFERMSLLFADEVISFRPDMPTFDPRQPVAMARELFIERLAVAREIVGQLTVLDVRASNQLVVSSVMFETGVRAMHATQFLPNLRICKNFMVPGDQMKSAEGNGFLSWTAEPSGLERTLRVGSR